MAADQGIAGEAKRKAFVQRLGQFRKTLDPDEQKMLDSMVLVAEGAHNQEDVKPYSWLYQGNPIDPGYYEGVLASGQTASPWWSVYNDPWSFKPS
jgi:hypothetical protein